MRRILALVLLLTLCITMIPSTEVSAAKKDNSNTNVTEQKTEPVKQETVEKKEPIYSDWAFDDLLVGDSYGIYPLTWYDNGLTTPITKAQMNVLVNGFNEKIRNAKGVTVNQDYIIELKDNMTVEEVLNVFYSVITSNKYSQFVGLNIDNSIEYMKEYGVFTGKQGELGLEDICSVEQACVFATRIITVVYDKLDASSKGFLWKIEKGENTVYLLGSIHVANNDIYPFSEKILEAYQSSDALLVEVNLFNQEGSAAFEELSTYTDGTTLKDHVSATCYAETVKLAATLGLSEKITASLKPWYISNYFTAMLSAGSGDTAEAAKAASLGIDINFLTNAYLNGKPIQEIEGYEKQGKMFDDFSAELQEYLLNSSIDGLNEVMSGAAPIESTDASLVTKWLDLWHDGNVGDFLKSYNGEDEGIAVINTEEDIKTKLLMEEYNNALLAKRDIGMANYIADRLQENGKHTYFVVVGALHYVSDYSVLDILEEKGYRIYPIK